MRFLNGIFAFFAAFFMSQSAVSADLANKNAYDFSFTSIDGTPMPLSQFKGKVLLVVNTASKCGFTQQYQGLQTLYDEYKGKGFLVIGVPSNDFNEQEPGSSKEIKEFCETKFRVNFPLAEKVHVKGLDAHPFYQWAMAAKGKMAEPQWNFHKLLISADGKLVDYYLSATEPGSEKVKRAIEKELKAAK